MTERFAPTARAAASRKENTVKQKGWGQSGQGLTEYIILVGLIALLVYGLVKTFGNDVGDQFQEMSQKIVDMKGAERQ